MNTMRRLLIVPLAALSMLLVAATCVANVEQKGPEGPWVGEVVNTGDQTVYGAGAVARIFDATGAGLFGNQGVFSCPSKLLPGERGAFELFINEPDSPRPPGIPGPDYEWAYPLRAEFFQIEEPPVGTGQARGDGLLVREIERIPAERRVRVELTNNSSAQYRQFTVCAVLRDANGKLLEVARSDGPPLPFTLFPGDVIALDLLFVSLPPGELRYHALGLWDAPYEDCCPANGPSTWTSVNNGRFSVLLPPGWAYEPAQGIDSFVGSYVGDGVTLHFDYGIYNDDLNFEGDPAHDVHEETIGGFTAKIVRATNAQGTTGVHFERIDAFTFPGGDVANNVGLTLAGEDLTPAQREIALQIFRSVRFNP